MKTKSLPLVQIQMNFVQVSLWPDLAMMFFFHFHMFGGFGRLCFQQPLSLAKAPHCGEQTFWVAFQL